VLCPFVYDDEYEVWQHECATAVAEPVTLADHGKLMRSKPTHFWYKGTIFVLWQNQGVMRVPTAGPSARSHVIATDLQASMPCSRLDQQQRFVKS
jgi:hypothetical protein